MTRSPGRPALHPKSLVSALRVDDPEHLGVPDPDPDQMVARDLSRPALGIDSFVVSGYTRLTECLVARHVLPALR